MTLNQILYALTIAETQSMNKAAEKLFISQPSLTNAIKELENETGIDIFFRTSKGVTLTNEGTEFLMYARQLYQQYELIQEKYAGADAARRIFAVSTQHYSFAVKAFVETVKQFDTKKYDFAIRETKTMDVIRDVAICKSEIGILYFSDFNRKIICKFLKENNLKFTHLIDCIRSFIGYE
ncbi:MAG: LysR family transcriptional regulator [Candidatus Ornithomonoglobus sp.]